MRRIISKPCYIFLIFFCVLTFFYIFWLDSLIYLINHLPGTVHINDTNRNIYEIIESRGFQYESHFVNTGKGNILQLIRIKNPVLIENGGSLGKPVLLQHGHQCSGSIWLISRDSFLSSNGHYTETVDDIVFDDQHNSVGSSLGFVLSARGYDVWLSNYRGNIYSINHTTYNTDDTKFWSFSIDEMISEDIPSLVNYIINETNSSSIAYIGHSQGNFMMFALLSERPHYSNYIKPFIAISPVFYFSKVIVPIMKFIPTNLFEQFLRNFPSFVPNCRNLNKLFSNLCENILFKYSCFWLLKQCFGSSIKNHIWERIGVYWRNVLNGGSAWNVAHFLQIIHNGGQPKHFDFGDEEINMKMYGVKTPPIYNASRINSPDIALIYSSEDYFNILKDIQSLKDNLNVKLLDDYMLPEDLAMNHLDLIWSNSTGQYVNKRVLEILSRY